MLKSEFTGETMVFAKDHNGRTFYQTSISKKKQDGTFENGYIDLQFKKGVELHNKTKINITKGWLTFYNNKDKRPVWQIFVNEFEAETVVPEGFQMLDEELDDSDLPF